jgi:outer membrane protein assembly factor BamB
MATIVFSRKISHLILTFLIVSILFLYTGCSATAQTTNEWPCFHGPDRINKSTETGLLQRWPAGGPKLILTIEGLGEGFSSVSVADGLIYTAGMVNNTPLVFSFDLNGKLIWKKPAGKKWTTTASWASSYVGPRSTPTYDNGIIYFLGEMGLLTAFEAKTGREIWHVDLPVEYDARPTEYGYSESVLIDGNNLYVRPVGKKGHQVCLDKRTGKLVWANTQIPGVEGYTSPVVSEIGGYRQVTGASAICYYGVDTKTGKLLWKVDVVNRQECNVSDAVIHNDHVFISSGYGLGSMVFKLNVSGNEIKPGKVWESSLMDNHHGGVIFHDGYVYGSGSRARGWYCLDFMTGAQKWRATSDEGSITFAEGMLYAMDQRGTMKLLRATPEKYDVYGEFRVPSGGTGSYWAHPVICGKKLYIRHADKIFVYDISRIKGS